MDVGWLARVTCAYIVDGYEPETVGHVGPQCEACMFLVTCYFLKFFPALLLHILVLKFKQILCGGKEKFKDEWGKTGCKKK